MNTNFLPNKAGHDSQTDDCQPRLFYMLPASLCYVAAGWAVWGEQVTDGQEIGSHGISETSLVGLASHLEKYQLSRSQLNLQSLTGQEVTAFAYPYGTYDPRPHLCAVKEM